MRLFHLPHLATRWHGMNRRKKTLSIGLCSVILILAIPAAIQQEKAYHSAAQSARYYFSQPDSSSVGTGEIFPVELRLNSPSAVNAASFVISFNPSLLQVVSMTTESSFCSFYAENSFDNMKGEVRVSCGTPNPGFSGDISMVDLKMRSQALGITQLVVVPKDSMALANDGKGTNLLSSFPALDLQVKQQL